MKMQHPPIAGFRAGQHLELSDDTICDPFQSRETLDQAAVCPDCNAVHSAGSWQWLTPPANALRTRCPACKRILENAPAGYISIEGRFASEYRNELQLLIRNTERRAKSEHPMQRIIAVEEQADGLMITTTDMQLARKIGEALRNAYKGSLDFHYNEAEYLLRVRWQRWN